MMKRGNNMTSLLKIVGILTIVGNIVVCGANLGVTGILIGIPMGFMSSLVFFAVAELLENQEQIFQAIRNLEKSIPSAVRKENEQICPKCNEMHHNTASNCPHCGHSYR